MGIRRFLIPACLVLLSGCGAREAVLVLDPYLQLSVLSASDLEECIRSAADEARIRVRTEPIELGTEPLEPVVEAVRQGGEETVILGPLFAGEAGSLLRLLPEKRFVFLAAGDPAREEDRLLFLPLDRLREYRAVGNAVADLLSGELPDGDGESPVAAAFFYTGTERRAAELEAFLDGYRSAGGPEILRVVEVDSLSAQEQVRAAFSEISAGSLRLLLASLSGLNGFLLDLADQSGVPVVTEYWEASGAYADRVLFSIEDDLCMGVRNALGLIAGVDGARSVPGRIAEGPAMRRLRETRPELPTWEEWYERQ